jgi:NitT/TauT family transport system substrate-binding protein
MRAVTYGIPTDKEAVQQRLGIEKGFFADEGLDLDIRVVFGGPEIAKAYDSGELEVGELGSPPATTALSRGARFTIVGSSIRRAALQYFVARPSAGSFDDLRGGRVGVLSHGSCSYWFARTVLAQHGLDPDRDVEVVGLGPRYPRIVELCGSGEFDGAVLSEPNVAIGEAAGAFRILKGLTDEAFCPTMQWSVIVANDATLARDPGLVRAVLRGCVRSYRYALEHPDELADFGARYFGIAPETMRRSIEREAPGLHGECEIVLDDLQAAIELQRRLGAFAAPLEAADLVDLSHLPTA